MKSPESRFAEVLGALSLACDVAFAFPLEKAMRTCVLAVELGRRHGLSAAALHDVYYSTLLTYAGCTAFTHEVSSWRAATKKIGRNSRAGAALFATEHGLLDPPLG